VCRNVVFDIARHFELETSGGKVTTAKKVARNLEIPWSNSFSSENTWSGGGGTLTKKFYQVLYDSL